MSHEYLSLLWPDERVIDVPISDGKVASCHLMGQISGRLIVLAHGLASSSDRTLSFSLAAALRHSGYSILRINFYGAKPHHRDLADSTIHTHTADLDAVVNWAGQQGAQHISVIGHSFGGLAILMSLRQFNDAILLDPSHPKVSPFHGSRWLPELDRFVYSSKGHDVLVRRELIDSFENLKPHEYTKDYAVPSLIITAGNGPLVKQHAEYMSLLSKSGLIEQAVIPGADHPFSSPDARHQLIETILKRLEQTT